MLTIEKNSQKVSFAFKERIKLWTPQFTLALIVALAIHLVGLLLFRVDLGVLLTARDPLPSVKVSSYVPLVEVLPDSNSRLTVASFLDVERKESPDIPNLPLIPLEMEMNPLIDLALPIAFDLSFFPNKAINSAAWLQFSGSGFAHTEMIKELMGPEGTHASLSYRSSAGTLFWLEWLQTTGDLQLDRQIELFLKSLQTALPAHRLVTEGIIEITFK